MTSLPSLSPAAHEAAGPRPVEAQILDVAAAIIGFWPTVVMAVVALATLGVLAAAFVTRNAPLQRSEDSSWDEADRSWQEDDRD